MSRLIERSHRWVLAVLVLGALTVGARALLAMPANLDCPDPPFNGGTCSSPGECEQTCGLLFPGYHHATCGSGGCCRCFL